MCKYTEIRVYLHSCQIVRTPLTAFPRAAGPCSPSRPGLRWLVRYRPIRASKPTSTGERARKSHSRSARGGTLWASGPLSGTVGRTSGQRIQGGPGISRGRPRRQYNGDGATLHGRRTAKRQYFNTAAPTVDPIADYRETVILRIRNDMEGFWRSLDTTYPEFNRLHYFVKVALYR